MSLLVIACAAAGLALGEERARPTSIEPELLRQDYLAAFSIAVGELRTRFSALGPRHPDTLRALHDVGAVAQLSGHHRLAEELLERAVEGLSGATGALRADLAESLWMFGSALRYVGQREAAWTCYEEALEILESGPPDCGLLKARILHTQAHWLRGESFDQALPVFGEALTTARAAANGPSLEVATVLTWLGWTLAQHSRFEEAGPYLEEAEALLCELELESIDLMGVLLDLRGVRAATDGDLAAAADFFGRAGAILEVGRDGFLPGYPRRLATLETYRRQAWALVELGRGEEAWSALQRTEANASEDFVLLAQWPERDPAGYRAVRSLRARYNQLRQQFGTSANWEQLIGHLELLAQIQQLEGAYYSSQQLELPTSAELAELLGPDTAYVGDLTVRFGLDPLQPQPMERTVHWSYVLRKDQPLRWVRNCEPGDLQASFDMRKIYGQLKLMLRGAGEWPFRMGPDSRVDRLLRSYGEAWFDPIEPLLEGVEQIVYESVGALPPVGAWRDSTGAYLVDRYVISSTPSAACFAQLAPHQGLPLTPVSILGSSGAPEPEAWLPQAHAEVSGILRSWPRARFETELLGDADQITARVRSGEFPSSGLIHFVGHAQTDPNPALCAFLIAAEGQRQPVRIEAEELFSIWRLNHSVVVMSGCRTANGVVDAAGESLGMLQTMFGAGARSAVGSLWEVDDWATSLLMENFHARLAEREASASGEPTVAEALTEAKRWLARYVDAEGRRPFEHPIYWAGFELCGVAD